MPAIDVESTPSSNGHGLDIHDLFAAEVEKWLNPREIWGLYAQWWDCIQECWSDDTELFPQDEWWYCDLYELEDTCLAKSQADAERIFRERHPMLNVIHVNFRGHEKPPITKKKRRRKSPANA